MTTIRITEEDATEAPVDLSGEAIRAYSNAETGTYSMYEGVGRNDGSFVIEGVPDGSYVLAIGSDAYRQYYILDDRDVSLAFRLSGRSEVVSNSDAGTELRLRLEGLDPWQPDDDLELFSFGSNTRFSLQIEARGSVPEVGATLLDAAIDFSNQPLVEAEFGDILNLLQWRMAELASYSSRTIISAARNDGLNQQNGQASELVAQLMPIAAYKQASLVNPWDALAEALPPTIDPRQVFAQSFVVASPHADQHGLVSFGAIADFRPQLEASIDSLVVEYPQLFPERWLWAYSSLSYEEGVTYLDDIYQIPSGITVEAPLDEDVSSYAISPPANLTFSPSVSTDDLEIRWEAPVRGTATIYAVDLWVLECAAEGDCRPRAESRLWTSDTALIVPREFLNPGAYAVRAVAYQFSGAGTPKASASIVKGPVLVATGASKTFRNDGASSITTTIAQSGRLNVSLRATAMPTFQ